MVCRMPQLMDTQTSAATGETLHLIAAPSPGLIEAAERCFARFGIERTTMSDIASEAGVHRATLYRHFKDRNQLVVAVLLKKCRPIIARAASRFEVGVEPSIAIVETLVAAADDALNDTELNALFTSSSAAVTAQLTSLSSEFFALALDATLPTLKRASDKGQLRDGIDPEDAIRWLLRVSLAFLTSEPRLDPDEQRRLLRTYVTPSIFTY